MNIESYFRELRFNKNHHLGMGDIRLTIAQQEFIENEIKKGKILDIIFLLLVVFGIIMIVAKV